MIEESARLFAFLLDYVESRGHFLDAGLAVHPRDEAALAIQSVTVAPGERVAHVFFLCASCLDPAHATVQRWMHACIEAAQRDAAPLVAPFRALRPSVVAAVMPGLTP